jgi:D-alanyl-D-alanine carboxypeptidase
MKNTKSLVLLGLAFIGLHLVAVNAFAGAQPVNSRGAIVINATTGKVLFEHDADRLVPPASITKILTLYLVFEAIHEGRVHPWDRVVISAQAANTGGSRMIIQAGTEVPLEELMKGMAVDSGNDACVAAAEHLAGSVPAFVQRMNHKAMELGMTHSHFENTNGLPAKGQVTTARDMAKLSLAYLQRFPESLRFHSMQTYTYNGVTQHNRNRLLGTCPGVDGIKTGWVCASGYNLVTTAKRGDTRILAVVLGAPTPVARTRESTKLIEVAYQKLAMGSPVIEVADLAAQADDEPPPPVRKHRKGKSSKLVAVKQSQRSARIKVAGAENTGVKKGAAQPAGNLVTGGKPGRGNAKQQDFAKHSKTTVGQKTSAKSGKPSETAKKVTAVKKSNVAPKQATRAQGKAQTTATESQKNNNAKKSKAEEPAKKGKAQIVKRSSEHS